MNAIKIARIALPLRFKKNEAPALPRIFGGHQVFFGSRNAAKGQSVGEFVGNNAQGGTNDEAVAFAEIILWTARGVMPSTLLANPSLLDGKILIDCNNQEIPPGFAYPEITESLAEKIAKDVPNARVLKSKKIKVKSKKIIPINKFRG